MLNKNSKDFYITTDGDFAIDELRGDLQTVDSKDMEIFKQHMMRRLMTSRGDFRFNPDQGASINDFIGLKNSAETGQLIKSQVMNALTSDNLFRSVGLDMKVFPMDQNTVALLLITQVSSVESDKFAIGFSYDLRDNKIIPRRL